MRVPEPAKRPSGVAIGLFTLRPRTANGFWRFYLAPSVLVAVIFSWVAVAVFHCTVSDGESRVPSAPGPDSGRGTIYRSEAVIPRKMLR